MSKEWINTYSTQIKKVVECENKECRKKFITNIDRKRCSRICANKARKQNQNNHGTNKQR